jgi:hypothetical protein
MGKGQSQFEALSKVLDSEALNVLVRLELGVSLDEANRGVSVVEEEEEGARDEGVGREEVHTHMMEEAAAVDAAIGIVGSEVLRTKSKL